MNQFASDNVTICAVVIHSLSMAKRRTMCYDLEDFNKRFLYLMEKNGWVDESDELEMYGSYDAHGMYGSCEQDEEKLTKVLS
jgi:hypothetical protein